MKLLWTDIETTGLDERGGLLLELGLLLTGGPEARGFPELATFEVVIGYPDIRSRIRSDYVREMHEANGLLDEVERSIVTLAEAEQRAITWVRNREAVGLPMAGSSPHFDRRWLREHMPELHDLYHHRMVDTTTLRILFDLERRTGGHRVIADLRGSLSTVRELGPLIDVENRSRLLLAASA